MSHQLWSLYLNLVPLTSCNEKTGENVELDGDGGDGNGSWSIWISDSSTMDSKHPEIGVDADIVGDIGDGSRTPDSTFFAFFEGRLSKSSVMFSSAMSSIFCSYNTNKR